MTTTLIRKTKKRKTLIEKEEEYEYHSFRAISGCPISLEEYRIAKRKQLEQIKNNTKS